MASRLELHDRLKMIPGIKEVYYQPPASIHLKFPCIVYKKRPTEVQYADNRAYNRNQGYTITLMDKNPDSEIPDYILELPYCRMESVFTNSNVYHHVYSVYY